MCYQNIIYPTVNEKKIIKILKTDYFRISINNSLFNHVNLGIHQILHTHSYTKLTTVIVTISCTTVESQGYIMTAIGLPRKMLSRTHASRYPLS